MYSRKVHFIRKLSISVQMMDVLNEKTRENSKLKAENDYLLKQLTEEKERSEQHMQAKDEAETVNTYMY